MFLLISNMDLVFLECFGDLFFVCLNEHMKLYSNKCHLIWGSPVGSLVLSLFLCSPRNLMPVGVYASPIGVRFVCLNISYSIWICLLLDLLRVVRNCSVPLVPEGDYRKFQMIRWVVALSWSIEIDRTFCFVDGWLSVLIHVLVHWWYTALFLCSGFFNGVSYYLSILGIGRWGFWPLQFFAVHDPDFMSMMRTPWISMLLLLKHL